MSAVLGIIGLVTVAALSPGPNNLIVLRTASRSGVAGAVPAIAGVVSGGLAMLAVARFATAAAFAAGPGIRGAVAVAGATYLGWLGLGLIRHAGRAHPAATRARGLPVASVSGLFAFQFLNPKSWVMVMTAVSASPTGEAASWWPLAAVFTAIPTVCLLLWASLGAAMAQHLARPRVAAWFDRAMGMVLLATAVALVGVP